jgi:hypothetical protein
MDKHVNNEYTFFCLHDCYLSFEHAWVHGGRHATPFEAIKPRNASKGFFVRYHSLQRAVRAREEGEK